MNDTNSEGVLAQRYTYATVAVVIGLLSFVNLFGFEKSILAVILGLKALGRLPASGLHARSSWAKSAIVLGTVQIVLVVTVILSNLGSISKLLDACQALSDGL